MPMQKMPFIPPGGFAGFAQQTAATQALLGTGRGSTTRRKAKPATRRKKPARRRPAARTAKRRATRKKPARLVKGSLAAKRHMAKLRRMRKKR